MHMSFYETDGVVDLLFCKTHVNKGYWDSFSKLFHKIKGLFGEKMCFYRNGWIHKNNVILVVW